MLIIDMPMPKFCIWRDDENEPRRCPLLNEDDNCVLQDSNIWMGWNEQYACCPIKGELVRCGECRRWGSPIPIELKEDGYGYCGGLWTNTHKDEYCAWGERKEGAE